MKRRRVRIRVMCKVCEKVQYIASNSQACCDCRVMLVPGMSAVRLSESPTLNADAPRKTHNRKDF